MRTLRGPPCATLGFWPSHFSLLPYRDHCREWALASLVPHAELAGRLCSVWQASLLHGTLYLGGVIARHLQAACFPPCLSDTNYRYLKKGGGEDNVYQKGVFQRKMYIYINRCCVTYTHTHTHTHHTHTHTHFQS